MRVIVVKQDVFYQDQFHKAGAEINMTDENLASHLMAMGDVRKAPEKSDGRDNKDNLRPAQPSAQGAAGTGRGSSH